MSGADPAAVDQRLFFALWPEPQAADELFELAGDLAATCGGRVSRKETLHMTLAFLGAIPESRLPAAHEAAAALVQPAFEIVLDRVGWWKHNRIVWAGATHPPAPLAALAEELRSALEIRGLMPAAPVFAPHVTLLRKARKAPPAIAMPALRWRIAEVVLVASRTSSAGASYTRLAVWPLAPGGG